MSDDPVFTNLSTAEEDDVNLTFTDDGDGLLIGDDPLLGVRARMEAKEKELAEFQAVNRRIMHAFEVCRTTKGQEEMKKQLRLHVRKLEIVAIIIDSLHQQVDLLGKTETIFASKKGHHLGSHANLDEANKMDHEVTMNETEFQRLQGEINSARKQFNAPAVNTREPPPSPVLAAESRRSRFGPGEPDEAGVPKDLFNARPAPKAGEKEKEKADGPAADADAAKADKANTPLTPSSARRASGAETTEAPSVAVPPPGADLQRFVFAPVPKHAVFRTRIVRNKKHHFNHTFSMRSLDGDAPVLFASKKAALGTHFAIYLGNDPSHEKDVQIADLRSSVNSHAYHLVEKSDHSAPNEVAVVYHKQRMDAGEGEYAIKSKLIIPSTTNEVTPTDDLYKRYKEKDYDALHVLTNKQAVWVPSLRTHILQFASKAITSAGFSSVKNFQLVSRFNVGHVLLEFGKVGPNEFELSFQHPLSPIQALVAALVVFL